MPPQTIYLKMLARPGSGYAASPLFRRAIVNCPKCEGECWIRVRFRSATPLGIVFVDCGWRHTYPQKEALPPAPQNLEF